MNTDETAPSIGQENSVPSPAANTAKPEYSLNDSLLMLNSALRYLTRAGVEITLQRGETGVVLTLQGLGIIQKANGATRVVPLVKVMGDVT